MIIHYENLFKEHFTSKDKNYTLENTMRYWKSIAFQKNIRTEVLEISINRGFSKLANGEKFPEKCQCGCSVPGIATSFIHWIRDDMLKIDNQIQLKTQEIFHERFKTVIESQLKHISKTNKQYIKMNRPSIKERSPVLRGFRKIGTRFFRNNKQRDIPDTDAE